jgi:hypothetical protein
MTDCSSRIAAAACFLLEIQKYLPDQQENFTILTEEDIHDRKE